MNLATDGWFMNFDIVPHPVKRLQATVRFQLRWPLPKGSYPPLRMIVQSYANDNECYARTTKLRKHYVEVEVLAKNRLTPVRDR